MQPLNDPLEPRALTLPFKLWALCLGHLEAPGVKNVRCVSHRLNDMVGRELPALFSDELVHGYLNTPQALNAAFVRGRVYQMTRLDLRAHASSQRAFGVFDVGHHVAPTRIGVFRGTHC